MTDRADEIATTLAGDIELAPFARSKTMIAAALIAYGDERARRAFEAAKEEMPGQPAGWMRWATYDDWRQSRD